MEYPHLADKEKRTTEAGPRVQGHWKNQQNSDLTPGLANSQIEGLWEAAKDGEDRTGCLITPLQLKGTDTCVQLTPTCLQRTANQAVWGLGPGCCLWSAGEVWLGKAGGPCVDLPLVAQGAGNPSRGGMEPGVGCGSHGVSSLPHSTPQCSS